MAVALSNPLPEDFPPGHLAAGRKADVGDALQTRGKADSYTILRCWLMCAQISAVAERSLTRSHGMADTNSMVDTMTLLVLSVTNEYAMNTSTIYVYI